MSTTIDNTPPTVDAPLVMDANYRFDAPDRRKIDDQIRGCERRLVTLVAKDNPVPSAIPASNIDWSLSDIHTITLAAGANTLTMSNVGVERSIVTVRITGAASTLTWDAGSGPAILFPGGTPPTQSDSGVDVYTFMYDGTSVYVVGGGQAFA